MTSSETGVPVDQVQGCPIPSRQPASLIMIGVRARDNAKAPRNLPFPARELKGWAAMPG